MSSDTAHTFYQDEIVALLRKKDEVSFGKFYKDFSGAIYGQILKLIPNIELAENVLQDTFIKIWNNSHQYDESKGRLYTWMLQIARNNCLDLLKSKSFKDQQKNQPIDNFVDGQNGVGAITTFTDGIYLNKILSKLPTEQYQIIDLAYYKGFTQEEISKHLNMPLGTVKTKARNALLMLKKLASE